ncbi:hypothetical protein GDO86_004282 [Hymenochirus boettgeri]|uniref:Solute carrier family 39 member 5 n=1 Tax=Hymenochirus boettgeri TaxID=247094 RepID=A0A8T2K772_9PIPI|nr:hypothetical protein GDO86_004282 [Hymenochirus boettgeri]
MEEAEKEQVYYLQQLFHMYGENDTLTYQGLTLLLQNLGLGKVQVVEIEHTKLGHNHVSHLDILDVQENKHTHLHSSREHTQISPTMSSPERLPKDIKSVETSVNTAHPVSSATGLPYSTDIPQNNGKSDSTLSSKHQWATEDILTQVIQLHRSQFSHQHEDCLNVTQLLMNYGLTGISEITPKQFALLCPALLFQIDSRVCIYHNDELTDIKPFSKQALLKALGWGALSVTLISTPSLLTIALVPLLRRPLFRYLLRFLVALAVGTLCGDALLHLLPHAQEDHTNYGGANQSVEPVMKGLSVLGGLYILFLIENLLGLLRKRKLHKTPPKTVVCAHEEGCTTALREFSSSVDDRELCEISRLAEDQNRNGEEAESKTDSHSHSVVGKGFADIVWMVLLGDGIHNLTDGLAIGAAFSAGFSGGLSTTIAVFCHELPHELGDFAVLMQSGVPMRKVLFFSLVSTFLSYLGMIVGTVASQSSAQIIPWIFAVTAGIFLYVALVDMVCATGSGCRILICSPGFSQFNVTAWLLLNLWAPQEVM